MVASNLSLFLPELKPELSLISPISVQEMEIPVWHTWVNSTPKAQGKESWFPVRKCYFAESGVVHSMEMVHLPTPHMLRMQWRLVGILIVSLSLAAKVPTKLWVSFLSPPKKNITLIMRCFVSAFLRKTEIKRFLAVQHCQRLCCFGGFTYLTFFFRWMACKFCANSIVLFQRISRYWETVCKFSKWILSALFKRGWV